METNKTATAATSTSIANAEKDKIDQIIVAALTEAGYTLERIGSHELVAVNVPGAFPCVEISAKTATSGAKRQAFDLEAAKAKYRDSLTAAEERKAKAAATKAEKEAKAKKEPATAK